MKIQHIACIKHHTIFSLKSNILFFLFMWVFKLNIKSNSDVSSPKHVVKLFNRTLNVKIDCVLRKYNNN